MSLAGRSLPAEKKRGQKRLRRRWIVAGKTLDTSKPSVGMRRALNQASRHRKRFMSPTGGRYAGVPPTPRGKQER